jgi:3-hydroxypropanoate dehydrogenase
MPGHTPLDDAVLAQLFTQARTYNGWSDQPVSDETVHALYDLLKWGPTSVNCSPARFVFIRSAEAKARLKPFLSGNNTQKTMAAPICVIIATDHDFAERIPELFPHMPAAKDWFADPKVGVPTAERNATLQGGYLILAARALGLDCGPMSGFDQAGVDAEFFAGTKLKSNFLCNLGYGTPESLFPRSPRLAFDAACKVL